MLLREGRAAFLYNCLVHQWDFCPLVYLNLWRFPHTFHPSRSVLFVDRVEPASITGMIMIEKGLWYLTNECWRDIYVMIQEELARVQTGKLLV